MYAHKNKLVPTPQSGEKGTIHILKTGYVYLAYEYHWDNENRRPVEKRVSIGKVDDSDAAFMYPNDRYEQFFGPIDAEADRLKKLYSSKKRKAAGKLDSRLSVGQYFAIEAACGSVGCLEALKRTYPSQSDLILALAIHSVVAEKSAAQAFPGWCFDHYCGLREPVSDSDISRLYKMLGSDDGMRKVFFQLYREAYEHRIPCGEGRVVAFDSTNQNTASKSQELSARGKAKQDRGLPIINTAMFVDEETGIPMWYEHFDGSVLDKSQTPYSLRNVIDMGYRKLFVMFDRGYYSESVIKAIRAIGEFEYGVLCPGNVTWVDGIISGHGGEIKDRQKYYIPAEDVYGGRYDITLFGMPCYAYLFYDAPRASGEHASIHGAVEYFWRQASERKRYSAKMEAAYARRGIIVRKAEKDPMTGKNFILLEDTEHIQSLLDNAGFFVMVSDTEMPPSEAIKCIRHRDVVEKSFESIKRHFGLSVTYAHSSKTYAGKMFMAFIASIIFASITWRLRSILSKETSTSLATVMAELNKYKIDLRSDGTWEPVYAMSKRQKQIFGALGLTEDSLIDEISKLKLLV